MKKLLSSLLTVCLLSVSTHAYSDVSSTQWHYPYITAMTDMGLIEGYPDNTFQPSKQVTLAEFSVLLSNAFYGTSLHMISQNDFSYWWEPYVYTCRLRDGLDNTTLGNQVADYAENGYRFNQYTSYTNEPLTRYDAAAMIANVLKDQYVSTPSDLNAIISQISDVDVSSPYSYSVAIAYHYGLLFGNEKGLFSGNDILTRAESSVILKAMVELQELSLELRSNAVAVLASPAYNMSNYNYTGNVDVENYVFARVNELRSALGLHTLTSNNTLIEYAYTRALETEIYWSHTRPDGSNWNSVISPDDTQNTLTGENLTMGSGFSSYEYPDMIFKSWLNSTTGHYENMINAAHQELGLAVYVTDNGTYYSTQTFAKPNT